MKAIFKRYLGCFVLILVATLTLTGLGIVFETVGVPEVIVSGMVFIGVLAFFGRRIYMKYKEK